MKKKSVIYKLLITFSIITSTILILVGLVLSIWINKEFFNQKKELVSNYVDLIEEATTKIINNSDESGYEDLINTIRVIKLSVKIDSIIIDSQGYVHLQF